MRSLMGWLAAVVSGVALAVGPVDGGESFGYEDYAAVLDRFVDERGLVDYAGLKRSRTTLDTFGAALAGVDRAIYDGWSEDEQVAFWINAYNALTLQLIVDHYPIENSFFRSIVYPKNSIMQIPGRWKKITFEVMGEPMTLDTIEHQVLRAKYDEPRIHMALVCAALSCPELRTEPFVAGRLDEQLDDQAREFLADERKFRIDREAGVVHLSAIFDWFKEDFVGPYGTGDPKGRRSEETQATLNFVSRYVSDAHAEFLSAGDFDVQYLDYDWTLNEQPAAPTVGD